MTVTKNEVAEQARALLAVRTVLQNHEKVVGNLRRYYDPQRGYTGSTFDAYPAEEADDITAMDLVAVSTMGVSFPALAVRRLLSPGETRTSVLTALAKVPHTALWEADTEALERAAVLHQEIKKALSVGNMWVTASKLTARKRPVLIPVRDSVIVSQLGLANKDFRRDWRTIQQVISDAEIRSALRKCADEAAGPEFDLSQVPVLRLLDAAMWMAWSTGGSGRAVSATSEA